MNRYPPEPIELVRPDDLLNLRIETENLRFERDPPSDAEADGAALWLVVDDAARPALLRVLFPPQHIAEFAVFESDPASKKEGKLAPDTSGGGAARESNHDPDKSDKFDKNDKPLGTLDPTPLPDPGNEPFQARIAAASRLVFRVPANHRIPYTVAGLLDWSALEPVLHPIAALGASPDPAARAAAPGISRPGADHTALELPYRLLISPDAAARWTHRSHPFGGQGRYELWHTRLLHAGHELDRTHTAPLRALWSPDYQPDRKSAERNRQGTTSIGIGKKGRSALSDDDRHQLVILTSAFHGWETDVLIQIAQRGGAVASTARSSVNLGPAPYVPRPFDASQLMLSPLGGWLKSRGAWTPPRKARPSRLREIRLAEDVRWLIDPQIRAGGLPARLRSLVDWPGLAVVGDNAAPAFEPEQLDLSEWVHVATQGRDHYVRVVYEGELWPFRHRAAMVKITERKFVQRDDGLVIACLVQRVFIVVREPEKAVFRHDSPLKNVRLTTLVTPNLVEPSFLSGTTRSFWIEVGAPDDRFKFQFHAVGTDHAGREVDFTIPLIFASISDTAQPAVKTAIDSEYNKAPDRAADFSGAKLAFTPLRGRENALLATRNVLFRADPVSRPPNLEKAGVTIPSVAELLGNTAPIEIVYDDTGADAYAKNGYVPANATGVFARLITPLPLGFRADQAGGFATPNQSLTALSNAQGPVAGAVSDAISDTFKPGDVFPKTGVPGLPALPQLFGTFGLGDLLTGGLLSQQAPRITTRRDANAIVTRIDWTPDVVPSLSLGVAEFIKTGEPRTLTVEGEQRTPLDGSASTSYFNGTLEAFDVVLLKSVTLHFERFAFSQKNSEKPDVKVALDEANPLEFTGDLKFVEDLKNVIPPGVFGDGASVTLEGASIRAGFSIGLPPVDIGVFALKDVSLGAALTLPFLDGKPVLDFNVCERANPFQLRVAFFAGGGFFRLQMDTQGMRQLEAALEFGAAFGLSIAVASGEVHAMAGIYYAITRKDGQSYCTLGGYMRLGGRLSVIGIVRLSVEFNLSFTYQEATDKAYGRATVTVMVEVLFISVSVSLTVERAFGGANDPVYLQTFPEPATWQEYASAFA